MANPRFTFDQHVDARRMTAACCSELHKRTVQVSRAYPLTGDEGKPHRRLETAIRAVEGAQWELDRGFHNEYPVEAGEWARKHAYDGIPALIVTAAGERPSGAVFAARMGQVKPRFTVEEHAEMGLALVGVVAGLSECWRRLVGVYPKSYGPIQRLTTADKALRQARAMLEDFAKRQHPGLIPAQFYYPDRETLQVSYQMPA
jgi:hypothetical protein